MQREEPFKSLHRLIGIGNYAVIGTPATSATGGRLRGSNRCARKFLRDLFP